jgi:hypothetical protein
MLQWNTKHTALLILVALLVVFAIVLGYADAEFGNYNW